VLKGRCPKCGRCYFGWALRFPKDQMCSNCGTALEIFKDGKRYFTRHSSSTTEENSTNLLNDDNHSGD